MPISINNHNSYPVSTELNKYHNAYKKNIDEKVHSTKSVTKDGYKSENVTDGNYEIRDYLSIDEKKVLREVFGEFETEKKETNVFYNKNNHEMMKGSKLDIKL